MCCRSGNPCINCRKVPDKAQVQTIQRRGNVDIDWNWQGPLQRQVEGLGLKFREPPGTPPAAYRRAPPPLPASSSWFDAAQPPHAIAQTLEPPPPLRLVAIDEDVDDEDVWSLESSFGGLVAGLREPDSSTPPPPPLPPPHLRA